MTTPRADVDAAVAGLQARWGAAAPRVVGALALAPEPAEVDEAPDARPSIAPPPDDRIIHTGFAALDAILGPGGFPRSASVAIRGDGSSGRTTLALRVAAEAQSAGSVVAWLDLSRSFDPVEAVARGIRLEWLVIITPASLDEGLSIAGSLLAGRSVDMLVLDLPGGRLAKTDTPAKVADRLHRLAALARRAETLLLILDAPGGSGGGGRKPAGGLATAVDQATGIRLELARRSWVRLGRDIVGQRTEALVAHNRHGPPGRTATLRILYAEGGERDACLAQDTLLVDALGPVPGSRSVAVPGSRSVAGHGVHSLPGPQGLAPRARNPAHGLDSTAEQARILPREHGSFGNGRIQDGPIHSLPTPQGMPPDTGHTPTVLAPVASRCRPRKKRGDVPRATPMSRTATPTPATPTPAAPTRAATPAPAAPTPAAPPSPVHAPAPEAPDRETHDHATSPPLRAAPSPGPGTGPTLRALPARPARAGRQAVGSGAGHRREPGRAGHGRPTRHAARERPSTRP